jgi:hypothetical protein
VSALSSFWSGREGSTAAKAIPDCGDDEAWDGTDVIVSDGFGPLMFMLSPGIGK